jgi:hypothetical protein
MMPPLSIQLAIDPTSAVSAYRTKADDYIKQGNLIEYFPTGRQDVQAAEGGASLQYRSDGIGQGGYIDAPMHKECRVEGRPKVANTVWTCVVLTHLRTDRPSIATHVEMCRQFAKPVPGKLNIHAS